MTESTWKRFLEEGEELYTHLTTHFEDLFEADGSIRRFDMRFTSYLTSGYYEEVHNECGEQVHREIIPWIREEHASGRLFCKENWKPFRDQLCFTDMYYGYRKIFCFHDFFYFQLVLEDITFDTEEGDYVGEIVFQVALYGWKENGMEKKQPKERMNFEEDMMMPEQYWRWN
jgi:hypothetical protein